MGYVRLHLVGEFYRAFDCTDRQRANGRIQETRQVERNFLEIKAAALY